MATAAHIPSRAQPTSPAGLSHNNPPTPTTGGCLLAWFVGLQSVDGGGCVRAWWVGKTEVWFHLQGFHPLATPSSWLFTIFMRMNCTLFIITSTEAMASQFCLHCSKTVHECVCIGCYKCAHICLWLHKKCHEWLLQTTDCAVCFANYT